jgi:hypothetical protein
MLDNFQEPLLTKAPFRNRGRSMQFFVELNGVLIISGGK